MVETKNPLVLVRGIGDIGSAVAVVLFRAGYAVVLHDEVGPTTIRRGMAFADAAFDGSAMLDGLAARRADTVADLREALIARECVPVTVQPIFHVAASMEWSVAVDARLRKRSIPEPQRGMAPLTIGLGPNFVAGDTVDLAVETSWGEHLGEVITSGATLPLAGEPRPLGGVGRSRFVYAPVAGRFATTTQIGRSVTKGEVVATIGAVALTAPLGGILRGLTRDGVQVATNTKVIEVDPRGNPEAAFGLGERPRRIAEGVLKALIDVRASALS